MRRSNDYKKNPDNRTLCVERSVDWNHLAEVFPSTIDTIRARRDLQAIAQVFFTRLLRAKGYPSEYIEIAAYARAMPWGPMGTLEKEHLERLIGRLANV